MKTGKTKNRIREGNPAVTVLLYVLVLLICIATVYPMYYVLILSISAPEYAAKNECLSGPERVFAGCV